MGCCDGLECERDTILGIVVRSQCRRPTERTTEATTTERCRTRVEPCDHTHQCCEGLHCARTVGGGQCSEHVSGSVEE
jgi:hypothetical protein